MHEKFYNFRNNEAIFRSGIFFAPSNKHIIMSPRLPTGIPFDCVNEAYEINEPSIVIPSDISTKELGRWLKWVLRASVMDSELQSQPYMQYFQNVPGIRELWEEKKKMRIPCIFGNDPEAHNRDFSIIPHQNALIGWYIYLSLYASGDQFLFVGYLATRLSGRIDLLDFDPFLPISAGEEVIGEKTLEWWRKFRDMEVDFTNMNYYQDPGEEITIKEAVKKFYEKIFGYRFIGGQIIRPSPEDIPQYDPTDPLLRHSFRSKKE